MPAVAMPSSNDLARTLDATLHITIAACAVWTVIGALTGKAWVQGY